MRLSAASVPKAAVLVHTKETLIKTPYRELREKIVLSPDYYIIFTAQCWKKQAEKQNTVERGCSSVLRARADCWGWLWWQLPQKQHKRGSLRTLQDMWALSYVVGMN